MELRRRLLYIVLVFGLTLLAGAGGYRLIEGWSLLEGLYMAVITVTTVGFSEVRPLSSGGRLFTTLLILVGVGTFTYSFSAIANYVITGQIRGLMGERRMRRLIASLRGHVIVCGFGRMGREVCQELLREKRPFVVVDASESSIQLAREMGITALAGDPGRDETLLESGIDRASGLAAVSDNDAKNLLVVISARDLNPGLSIVARVSAEDAPEKFHRAGADSVFLPYRTGGRRVAQMVIKPAVVGFMEDVLYDESALGLLLENLVVDPNSEFAGMALHESRIRERTGVYVLGLKRHETNEGPELEPNTVLESGDTVIALGKREQLDTLSQLLEYPKT